MIPITPDTVKATYTYLLSFPPFSRWKMLAAEDLTFLVVAFSSEYAQYNRNRKELRVSSVTVGKHQTLLKKMSHEMIHVHEDALNRWSQKHDTQFFIKCRDQVCKVWDFDPADF
jgi:hypothetical protein